MMARRESRVYTFEVQVSGLLRDLKFRVRVQERGVCKNACSAWGFVYFQFTGWLAPFGHSNLKSLLLSGICQLFVLWVKT